MKPTFGLLKGNLQDRIKKAILNNFRSTDLNVDDIPDDMIYEEDLHVNLELA